MELEFVGDWSEEEAARIASTLKKSISMGDGGAIPDSLTPPSIATVEDMLSDRHRKLISQFRTAGKKALSCDPEDEQCENPSWDDYEPLTKAPYQGQVRITSDGQRLVFNDNNRWERYGNALPKMTSSTGQGQFQFPITPGQWADGVYFSINEPAGNLRIRLRIDVAPEQLIDEQAFSTLDADLSHDIDVVLDSRNVRAIASSDGSMLMVRDPEHITPLGILAGTGDVPQGKPVYRLVEMQQEDDHLIVEVEMGAVEELSKAAKKDKRRSLSSKSHLNGTPLVVSGAPQLDRRLVRDAIARCKKDGVDFDGIEIKLSVGKPDLLPGMVRAFCLPSDSVIHLCPHDPQGAIATFCQDLAARLKTAVNAGAVSADDALDVLTKASQLTPDWWLEMTIKRYVGAILAERHFNVMNGGHPPTPYLNLLAGRGLSWWANQRTIAECMAEDYRCAHDPAGVPNLVTLEFDLAVGAIARLSQSLLVKHYGQADRVKPGAAVRPAIVRDASREYVEGAGSALPGEAVRTNDVTRDNV